MQLAGKHVSMIGVGITAIAAIGGLLYYRSRSGSDAGVDSGGGGVGFPYFQTAALPSSGTGGSFYSVAPSTAVDTSAADTSALLDKVAGMQKDAASAGIFSQMISSVTTLLGKQADQLSVVGGPGSQDTPNMQAAYVRPTGDGGYTFGLLSNSVLQGLGYGLGNIYTSAGSPFTVPPNSTGGGSQVPAVT